MAFLPTAVYTAWRGYAWTALPPGLTREDRDDLYQRAAALRPDFPSADDVRQGVVTNGNVGAVFRVWNVPSWDADGRSADYFAFAYFPVTGEVSEDGVARLLEDPFFHIPERNPPEMVRWRGGNVAPMGQEAASGKASPVDARFAELLSRYVERGKKIDLLETSADEYKRRWLHESKKCRWWMMASILLFLLAVSIGRLLAP